MSEGEKGREKAGETARSRINALKRNGKMTRGTPKKRHTNKEARRAESYKRPAKKMHA